jgi:hypothetical protein
MPILTYAGATWGLTQNLQNRVSACHRRHLRTILGVRYPQKIRNVRLYEITGESDIAKTLKKSRLRLLGHCLRLHESSPAFKALVGYFDQISRRVGRPRTTLPLALNTDLQSVGLKLESAADVWLLRILAEDRDGWRRLTQC